MYSYAAREYKESLISKAQAIINKVLKSKNAMVYIINADGSFIEIQPGCTLLSMDRYKIETLVGGKVNDRML